MARTSRPQHQKRYGHHQKHTAHFMKTYWPYMPLLLIISTMVVLSIGMHRVGRGVLSYATNVSSSSLLEDTNQQRLTNHVAPLKINPKLAEAAQSKANDMAKRNYWSHNTPDGSPPWSFIDSAGYTYQKAGENLAYGFGSSNDTVTGWMNSPPHRENLLDSAFQDVGFGYANVPNYQNKGEETVVVAMYGLSRIALTPTTSTGTPLNNSTVAGISTLGAVSNNPAEPAPRSFAVIQLLAGERLAWLNAAIIILGTLGLMTLLIRHSLALRRVLLKSERYALHHPLFDITVVSFLGLCLMLSQTAGIIR